MSRLGFTIIILMTAVVIVLGMTITAGSLEELVGKPVTVLAVQQESTHTRITFLGRDYEIHFSELLKNILPADSY